MGNAKVIIRLRPRTKDTDDSVQKVGADKTSVLMIKRGDNEDGLYQFKFTDVLSREDQVETYQACAQEIVESVIQGYNGTIMAYGQTGAGKTYTITGDQSEAARSEQKGIVPRALQQIFAGLRGGALLHWTMRLSYLEIYNESFTDLLRPESLSSDMSITESKGVINVRNLTTVECKTIWEAEKILQKGLSNRVSRSHQLNSDSSRSHTILSVWLDMLDKDGNTLSSKLNFVDLAGSERLAKTGTQGAAAKEAMHINKSLTFLEQTVIALARRRQYVPFRSSKLTHFLKDSIGGNCKTLLIACAWSDAEQLNETLSTCRFAQRMMQVAEDAQKNCGGLSSIHGNLFKLDPVMQQYLESMTAAAVAKEKAALYAEFERLRRHQGGALGAAEMQELEALRLRVKELEVEGQTKEAQQREAANEITLHTMNALRSRVVQLERDIAAAREVQQAAGMELPTKESQELPLGVVQTVKLEEPRFDVHSWIGDGTEEEEEEIQEEEAGLLTFPDSQPEEIAASLADADVSAPSTGESIKALLKGTEKEVLVDVEQTTPESSPPAVTFSSPERPSKDELKHSGRSRLTAVDHPASSSVRDSGHLIMPPPKEEPESTQEGSALPEASLQAEEPARARGLPLAEIEQPNSEALPAQPLQGQREDEWLGPDSLTAGQLSDSCWEQELSSFSATQSKAKEHRVKKRSLLGRMFGRKGDDEEHDSFSTFGASELHEDDQAAPNIVILNSLNHNQLLELLKARPLQGLQVPEIREGDNLAPATPDNSAPETIAQSSSSCCSTATAHAGTEAISPANIEEPEL